MASPSRTAALLAALLAFPAPGVVGNGQRHRHIDGMSPPALSGTAAGVVIDLATEAQTEILGAPAKDQLGNDLRLGDVNADGLLDVLAGAHWGSESGRNIVGRSYALFGRPAWPGRIDLAGAGGADWSFIGAGREARMGSSMATADLDGDGQADLALGSLLGDPFGQVNGGAVYIMFGGPDVGGHVDFLVSEADALLAGSSATEGTDQLGTDMAAGDFDADGHQDLAVAAALRHDFSGAVFVFRGPFAKGEVRNLQTSTASWELVGSAPRTFFGSSVAAADINDDGRDDLLVGSIGAPAGAPANSGSVAVYFGGQGPEAPSEPDLVIVGAEGDQVGTAFSTGACSCRGRPFAAADFTADGKVDLAIGAPSAARRRGRVHVVPGPLGPGVLDLATAAHLTLAGGIPEERLGWSVAAGSLDGDPQADLVVAAPWSDVGQRVRAGRVFGLQGPLPPRGAMTLTTEVAGLVILGPGPGSGSAGITIALGDTDGDGAIDLHLGFPDAAPNDRRSVGALHRLAGPLLPPVPTATPSPSSTATATAPATATATATATASQRASATPPAPRTASPSPTPTVRPSPASPTPSATSGSTPTSSLVPGHPPKHRLHLPLVLRPLVRSEGP